MLSLPQFLQYHFFIGEEGVVGGAELAVDPAGGGIVGRESDLLGVDGTRDPDARGHHQPQRQAVHEACLHTSAHPHPLPQK